MKYYVCTLCKKIYAEDELKKHLAFSQEIETRDLNGRLIRRKIIERQVPEQLEVPIYMQCTGCNYASELIEFDKEEEIDNYIRGDESMPIQGNLRKANEAELRPDLSEFDGRKVKIADVGLKPMPKGGVALQVSTEVMGTKEIKGEMREIMGSALFGIEEIENANKEKELVWSPKGNLQKFLDKHKVSHPNDLIGKEVLVTINEKGYLTIVK